MDLLTTKTHLGYNKQASDTHSSATFEYNETLNRYLQPITTEYIDLQGNLIQLWRWKIDTLVASVRDKKGQLSFVTEHRIYNGINTKESGKSLSKRLISQEGQPKHWHLAYTQGGIHVWPQMKAAAKADELDLLYPPVPGENGHKGWKMVFDYPVAPGYIAQVNGIPHESIRIDTLSFNNSELTSQGGKRSSRHFWKAWTFKRPETLCSQQILDDLKNQGIQLDQLKPAAVKKTSEHLLAE